MKILLTGHTSNIGKVLYEHLTQSHEVLGVSRQSGYDLHNKECFDKIVNLSLEYDHVINLAYVKNIQVELLYSIHSLWTTNNKQGKIINAGTLGTDLSFELMKILGTDLDMVANKLNLEKLHNELRLVKITGKQPESVMIRFGAFNKKHITALTPKQIVNAFDFVLNSDYYISDLDFRAIE